MRIGWLIAAIVMLTGLVTPAAAQHRAWTETVARTAEGGYRLGNPDAPVKLVEYGSRMCPTCAHFAKQGMAALRTNYIATGKVSYEYRDYLVHGAPDLAAALVNQCVPADSFFPVLEQIFAQQDGFIARNEALSRDEAGRLEALPPAESAAGYGEALGFVAFIARRGVSEAAARACLADRQLIDGIASVNADAVRQDLAGTPTFIINGKTVEQYEWVTIEPLLKTAIR